MTWPNDADGDVFRRLENDNFSFNKTHIIEFFIDFESWPLTEDNINKIINIYPNIEIIDSNDKNNSDGYMSFEIKDILTYDLVIDVQNTVTEQMSFVQGRCESWEVESS